MKMVIRLNGTDENPFERYGLECNPFPIRNFSSSGSQAVQKLGGTPIPDEQYIRKILTGFTPEFVNLCVSQYRKGQMVEFVVEFPER